MGEPKRNGKFRQLYGNVRERQTQNAVLGAVDHCRGHHCQLHPVVRGDDPRLADGLVAFEENRKHGSVAGVDREQ